MAAMAASISAGGGVGEDGHDPGPRAGGRGAARQRRQARGLGQGQARGVPGTRFKPMASAPARMRREHALGVGDAADLDERQPRFRSHVVWHRTRGHEGTRRRGRLGRAHQRLPDEGSVEPDRPPADQRPGLADARFADHQPVVRHQRSQSQAQLGVDLKRAQIAVVQPDQAGVGGQGRLELALVVDLDERLQAQLAGQLGEAGELLCRQDGGEEQDHVGAGGAQDGELALVDDELLGEDRERDRGPDRAQVGDRAAEPVRLAQDGDGARAAGLVGSGQGDRIGVGGDGPGRRRAALDLGDEMQARRGQALGDRPRGGPGAAE